MSEIVELGKRFYDEHLKSVLEPQDNGKFVAIEPESEQYFVGQTDVEAAKKGKDAFPQKVLFLARIGFPTAHKIGGNGKRKR